MLLTGEDREQALHVAGEIADALAALPPEPDASVGRGASGVAVFLATYAGETGEQRYADVALTNLDVALDLAMAERPNGSLYAGTPGVGWVLTYLEGRVLDPEDGAADVDELVIELVDHAPWPSYDLIRGLVGAGVYLLARPAGAGLARLVERLDEMSVPHGAGVTWWTDPATVLPERAAMYPDGYYDIGVAHGQAGAVALLAALHVAGVPGADSLLASATAWLRAQRLPGGFPALVSVSGGRAPVPSRVAWCYGDAGVAAALLAAGVALEDAELVAEARDVAVVAAERTDHGVVDAGLCHGSAGLLHVFNRLATRHGDERLAAAARRWYADLLARRDPALPYGGFPRLEVEENDYRIIGSPGFLEGTAGVGLALLAATSDAEPAWDALLLTGCPA